MNSCKNVYNLYQRGPTANEHHETLPQCEILSFGTSPKIPRSPQTSFLLFAFFLFLSSAPLALHFPPSIRFSIKPVPRGGTFSQAPDPARVRRSLGLVGTLFFSLLTSAGLPILHPRPIPIFSLFTCDDCSLAPSASPPWLNPRCKMILHRWMRRYTPTWVEATTPP